MGHYFYEINHSKIAKNPKLSKVGFCSSEDPGDYLAQLSVRSNTTGNQLLLVSDSKWNSTNKRRATTQPNFAECRSPHHLAQFNHRIR